MKTFVRFFSILVLLFWFTNSSHGQVLKKLKNAAKKEAKSLIEAPAKEEMGMETGETEPYDDPNRPENRKGKKMTPPDVNENIEMASEAYANHSYGDTKFAIKQAIMGVELEIGHMILDELPMEVNGMKANTEDDEIYSAGIGFIGLNIGRFYDVNSQDQDLQVAVSNNSGMVTAAAMSYSNMGYTSENEKMVRVQGFKGMMRYDEYEGYSLAVTIGQSSVFIMECRNFADENEVISVADNFDLKRIQSLLGEQ